MRQALGAETVLTQQSGGTQSPCRCEGRRLPCPSPFLCSIILSASLAVFFSFYILGGSHHKPRVDSSLFGWLLCPVITNTVLLFPVANWQENREQELRLLSSGLSGRVHGLHGHLLWCLLRGTPSLVWKLLHLLLYHRHSLHLVLSRLLMHRASSSEQLFHMIQASTISALTPLCPPCDCGAHWGCKLNTSDAMNNCAGAVVL